MINQPKQLVLDSSSSLSNDIDMIELDDNHEEFNTTTTTTTKSTSTTTTTTTASNQTKSSASSFAAAKMSSSQHKLTRDDLDAYEKQISHFTDHTFKAILILIAVIMLLTAVIMFLIFKNRYKKKFDYYLN